MTTPPQERFKERVIQLCEFVKNILAEAKENGLETPASPFVMDLIINFIKKEDSDKVITTFILRSHASWDRAHAKEQDYFRTDGLKAFYGIPEKSLEDFNQLFDVKKADGSLLFDESTQEGIWEMFHSLIKNSVCYIHCQRDLKEDPETGKKKYTKNFFPEISIKKNVEMWKIASLD